MKGRDGADTTAMGSVSLSCRDAQMDWPVNAAGQLAESVSRTRVRKKSHG